MSLKRLQEIRERRLDKQMKEVQAAKSAMQTAEQHLQQCRLELEQYHYSRLQRQEDLFKSLQGQSCSPQNMFEYRAKIEKLTAEEEHLKNKIISAEDKLNVAKHKYADAKSTANHLALKNEKTKEIVEIQDKAELALQQVQE